jgi:hypothetical protein
MAAQKGLGDAMLRPQTGPLVHQTVVDAVGGPASPGAATANDFARQSMLQTNGGKLVRPVKELDTHLYNPHSIADRVFSPAELQSLRVANFNRATMAKRPAFSAKLHAGFASELSKWGSRAASAAVGHALGASLGVPLGEAGGLLLEQIGERVAKGRGLPHELNAVGKPPSRVAAIRGAVTAPTRNAVLAQLGRQQQPSPQATPSKVTSVTPLVKAFHDQESGGGRDISTSANNAHGDMQITPETFAKYALPGEHIDNRDDNMAVGKRILEDYEKRYDGDAARIATAYFSGPGNVAPPGSPTPWLEDRHDASGKRVSSYVADIVNRLSRPQRASGGRTGINHAEHAAALVRAADRAKKANGQQTSALLNVADATIAKALYVANRSI